MLQTAVHNLKDSVRIGTHTDNLTLFVLLSYSSGTFFVNIKYIIFGFLPVFFGAGYDAFMV